MKLQPGTTLGEHYQIDRILGRGAVGHVFLAQDMALNRPVAIKVLRPKLSQRFETDERFRREARLLSRLNHPNVVVIHAFGKTDDGSHYIVMEYISGMGLDAFIVHNRWMDPPTFCHVVQQIADAMEEAHRHGIVHRDLKPENILLCQVGADKHFVKVVDFGLAKVFLDDDPDDEASKEVTRHKILGSPPFMAPEQVRIAEVDARTDIYALGILSCLLLTGRLPFKATLPQEFFHAHLKATPTPPSELRPELELTPEIDAVITRALAKDPDKRFQSAKAFARAAIQAVRSWEPEHFSEHELQGSGLVSAVSPVPETPRDPIVRALLDLEDEPTPFSLDPRHLQTPLTTLHLALETSADALPLDEHAECLGVLADKIEQATRDFDALPTGRLSDSMRLLFGLSGDPDKQAELAVDAALAIRAALRSLRSDPTLPSRFQFRFQIGVDAGRLLLNLSESGRCSVHGSSLGRARMLAHLHAEADSVVLSPALYRRVHQLYDGNRTGEAVCVTKKRTLGFSMQQHHIHGQPVELIGREEEVNLLRSMLAECIRSKATITAMLRGPRGIGKSRVVQHFVLQILELPDFYQVYAGRCHPAEPSPYGPFLDALRNAIRFEDSDSPVVARLRVQQFFRRKLARDATNLTETEKTLLGELEQILGLGEQRARVDEDETGRLPDLITQLLGRMATHRPTVLIIEDVQWASPEALMLLRLLTGQTTARGLLVVGAARVEPGEEIGLYERNPPEEYIPLDLARLDSRRMQALIRHILRAIEPLPDGLVNEITELSDGVPLVAEEIIRDLIDQDTIVVSDGAWSLDHQRLTDRLSLPESIEQLFMARVGRLPESLRAVIDVAAVAGDRFWPKMIQEILEDEGSELPRHPLRKLARRGLVVERRDAQMAGEAGYNFAQHAVQEGLYRMIPRDRRQALHQAIARWLERNTRDKPAGYEPALGKHFYRSGDLDRAYLYLKRAAERAAQTLLVEEAIAYLEMCLELIGRLDGRRDDERLSLEQDLIHYLHLTGRNERAVEVADALLVRTATRVTDASRRARIALAKGNALQALGRAEEAIDAFQLAIELCQTSGDASPLALEAATRSTALRLTRGDGHDATRDLADAVEEHSKRAAEDIAWCQALSDAHRVLGDAALTLGDHEDAHRAYRRAYELALTSEANATAVEALLGIGMLAMRENDLEHAAGVLGEALETADRSQLPYHRAAIQARLGELHLSRAEWSQAAPHLDKAADFYRLVGDHDSLHKVLCMLSAAATGGADLDRALAVALEATRLTSQCFSTRDALQLCLTLFERILSHDDARRLAGPLRDALRELLAQIDAHQLSDLRPRAQALLVR